MHITVSKQLGKTHLTFAIEGADAMKALAMAGFLSAMPSKCNLCGSENVHLASNKAKGYLFVKVLCDDCNARAQLGQYKDGGYFWKQWEKYESPKARAEKQPDNSEVEKEEIPF